jgi:nitrite reductase/ring-hydroxylating ferredoxin subunit
MVTFGAKQQVAFAVRYHGRVYSFLNQCAHQRVELDWEEGRFFSMDGEYLICATHGALYEPQTGRCVAGPCRGAQLIPVATCEFDGAVWLVEGEMV